MKSERKEHIDEAGFCRHCLATVDDDGYAVAEQEQITPYEGEETEQRSSTIAMRHNAGSEFADAVRGYAEGGYVSDDFEKKMKESDRDADAMLDSSSSPDSAKKAAEEMRRKKMERYGRMGK